MISFSNTKLKYYCVSLIFHSPSPPLSSVGVAILIDFFIFAALDE